jgi:hypothetical protein
MHICYNARANNIKNYRIGLLYMKLKNDFASSQIKGLTINTEKNYPEMEVFLIDGSIKKLPLEQISHFIHLGIKNGTIGKELAKASIGQLREDMPYIESYIPPSQEEINKLYVILQKKIEAGKDTATASGKELLILVAEDHYDRRSLIAEAMAINICKDIGINDCITETTAEVLSNILSDPGDQITSTNAVTIFKMAEIRGMRLHNGDPKTHSGIHSETRKDAMNAAIISVDTNCIMIVGVGHPKDIIESKEVRDKYEIVAIDASFIGSDKAKQKQLFSFPAHRKKPVEYTIESPDIMHLEIPGNPFTMTTAEMVETTIIAREKLTGNTDDKNALMSLCANIAISQAQGETTSLLEPLGKEEEKLNKILEQYPGKVDTRLERATLYMRQNRLAEAQNDYNYILANYPDHIIAVEGIAKIKQLSSPINHPVIQALNSDRARVPHTALGNPREFERVITSPQQTTEKEEKKALLPKPGEQEEKLNMTLEQRQNHPVIQALNKDKIIVEPSRLSNDKEFNTITTKANDKYIQHLLTSGQMHYSNLLYTTDAEFNKIIENSKHPVIQALNLDRARVTHIGLEDQKKFERVITRCADKLTQQLIKDNKVHISSVFYSSDNDFKSEVQQYIPNYGNKSQDNKESLPQKDFNEMKQGLTFQDKEIDRKNRDKSNDDKGK